MSDQPARAGQPQRSTTPPDTDMNRSGYPDKKPGSNPSVPPEKSVGEQKDDPSLAPESGDRKATGN